MKLYLAAAIHVWCANPVYGYLRTDQIVKLDMKSFDMLHDILSMLHVKWQWRLSTQGPTRCVYTLKAYTVATVRRITSLMGPSFVAL
jgi:hypothetical protein